MSKLFSIVFVPFVLFFVDRVCSKHGNGTAVPVILWHGMGDSCCNPLSMGYIKKLLEKELPGVYVVSLEIGNNVIEDTENGFFMNANKQVSRVCHQLANDSRLRDGYNAIGFSQGAQFLRALAQRCPNPPMKNLISLGGQHQGVNGMPHCPATYRICSIVRHLLDYGAYAGFVQNSLVQAQYWHDPRNEKAYREKSIFLADINNERVQNDTYKNNLLKLERLVLVKFLKDTMIVPLESAWFGFYTPGQDTVIQEFNETDLYKQDRLGLRKLQEDGRLVFLTVDADHLRITEAWFIENIIKKYLS